ncbi:hypothetical protein OKA05_10350 [Luteolibacter arcticus]|uniref:Uncharacterized protein n=1 Tax=Luteolibacter arcticus TaxID=1581411 RepID=A0ABT3GH54_9BACT|nr:hypothetical protein [Luteolibacter arcticus]MCW1922952.1 hypothetical protein [Luteolibacter arcticus]
MALQESWHIRSRSRACSSTERAFEDGEAIMTALFPDPESSGYMRKDFCLEAWKARTAEDEKPLSFWKTIYHAPVAGEKKDDAFKRESPEELLRRLVEEEEEHTENVRYILAVMLERQKVLRETDTQRTPSGILRVYEHRKLGDVFIVRDPDIPLSQVDKVQEEVILLLESGGRMPEPEEEIPAEGEASAEPEASSEAAAEAAAGDEPTEEALSGPVPDLDALTEVPEEEADDEADEADEDEDEDDEDEDETDETDETDDEKAGEQKKHP